MTAELFAFVQKQVLDSQAQVLERLNSIDKHLIELNGSVARNTRDVAGAKIASDVLQSEYVKHCVALAVLQERDKHQMERNQAQRAELAEQKDTMKDLAAKVWDNAGKIGSLIATVALITKMAELW